MMANCDGTISSDDLAIGLLHEACFRTSPLGSTSGADSCIFKAMAYSSHKADLNTDGRKTASRKLLRALKNRQALIKAEGTWNKDDDTDNDSE